MIFEVFLVVVGVCDLLEVAADHCGGLVMLSHGDGLIALVAAGYENVSPHKVHEVCSLKKELRHPGIVVIATRNMAVGPALGFLAPHSMRDELAKGLPAQPFSGTAFPPLLHPAADITLL